MPYNYNPYTGYYPYVTSGYPPLQSQTYYQQPQTSVQNTQISPIANQSSLIWVNDEQEASMYPIAQNCAVALWERSGKTIYLKYADATGKPTMVIYDLVERQAEKPKEEVAVEEKQVDYLTKDDLKDMISTLTGLKSDIDRMKDDLYGIAGKKSRDKEIVEND